MMRIVSKQRTRGVDRGRAMLAITVTLTVALGISVPAAQADEADASAHARAERLAISVCGTCHGPTGNSSQPKFPRLAGQKESYLVGQLKAFRSQSRGDPDAISYMWGMASELDDVTIEALAAHYAAQKPEPRSSGRAAPTSAGQDIYLRGAFAHAPSVRHACLLRPDEDSIRFGASLLPTAPLAGQQQSLKAGARISCYRTFANPMKALTAVRSPAPDPIERR